MKEETTDVSRRNFLTKGAVVAAGASILAIESLAPPNLNAVEPAASHMLTNDPVYTESAQTLTNKTISSAGNILGTDAVNVREFSISGTDITSALTAAINSLKNAGRGGKILIPRGQWTTNGGHDLSSSITVEGAGVNSNGFVGSEIQLNANQSTFVFRVLANNQNCALKDLSINLSNNNANGIGLLLTNYKIEDNSVVGTNLYFTSVTNVFFNGGAFGIKVASNEINGVSTNFECILNRFEKVEFIGCKTAFYCNSINGGYTFDNCYFALPNQGTALHCIFMGNMAVEHCLFVGGQQNGAWIPATDGTTILKTVGAFNNISFYDCQDENVQYTYRNDVNPYDYVPLVFRNCLIQSKLKFTAHGAVILEACHVGTPTNGTPPFGAVEDSSTGRVLLYLKGTNNVYTQSIVTGGPIANFSNVYSQIIYESKEIGLPSIQTTPNVGYTIHNASRGIVIIPSGSTNVVVNSNLVNADSMVFAQLRDKDSGGAIISNVKCLTPGTFGLYFGSFQIELTKAAAANLTVGFKIEVQ